MNCWTFAGSLLDCVNTPLGLLTHPQTCKAPPYMTTPYFIAGSLLNNALWKSPNPTANSSREFLPYFSMSVHVQYRNLYVLMTVCSIITICSYSSCTVVYLKQCPQYKRKRVEVTMSFRDNFNGQQRKTKLLFNYSVITVSRYFCLHSRWWIARTW